METQKELSISSFCRRPKKRFVLKKIFWWLHFLTDRVEQLFVLVRQLQGQTNTIPQLQGQLNTALGAIQQLQAQMADVLVFIGPLIALRNELAGRVGQTVTVQVGGTAITGVLELVGTDFVQVQEATGNLVFIPIRNIEGVA
ncbi:hypothetical protein [Laceyella putida]|uniref:DUF2642 domain-containing protein n=1 Tax=Laceyella putida TaxID=110101 RepID=A0ABW2RL37_9BACL